MSSTGPNGLLGMKVHLSQASLQKGYYREAQSTTVDFALL